MRAACLMIEQALDEFFRYQQSTRKRIVARRVTRSVIARCAQRVTGQRPSLDRVSYALQDYRLAQQTAGTTCKYRIAARSYARAALWYVMDGPGLDSLEGEAMTLAHVEWVSRDLAARATSDALHELIPSAAQHPTIAGIVASTTKAIEMQLSQMVDRARAESDFYEQVTARTVEVVPSLTQEESDLLAELP